MAAHDLAIDSDGNLVRGAGGDIATAIGLALVQQRLRNRLSTQRGEWLFDTSHGTPWHERVLGQKRGLAAVQAVVTDVILATPGVLELVSLSTSFDRTTRRFSYTAVVRSTEGTITLTQDTGA